MAENETPADQVRSVMAKNLEGAQGAIANYFQIIRKEHISIAVGPDRSDQNIQKLRRAQCCCEFWTFGQIAARKRPPGCLAHPDRVLSNTARSVD